MLMLISSISFCFQYIVIMHKGIYYKLDVYDKRGQPVLPQNLQEQLQWIVEDANKHQGIEFIVIIYTES